MRGTVLRSQNSNRASGSKLKVLQWWQVLM